MQILAKSVKFHNNTKGEFESSRPVGLQKIDSHIKNNYSWFHFAL